MSFLTSLQETINPKITIKHIQTQEETDSGTLEHEFVCFDAENVTITNIFAAKMLARKMGKKVFPFLEKLAQNTKDEQKLAKILKTKAWVYKKAVWHPALVEKCNCQLLKKMKADSVFHDLPLSFREIYTDTAIAAILHDIGRLSEVDVLQGTVCMERGGLKKHHALISYDILEHASIKPEILLAIKYHEFADVDEVVNDKLFNTLSENSQKVAKFYTYVLQDMDKTANLSERSVYGIKKCAEFFDSHYVQDYDLTEEHFLNAKNGQYLRLKGGHLLDAMMRFVTWTYCIHFQQTKEILSKVLTDFFWQMYQEAIREYENSEDKNAARLARTLEKITQLEDYAIAERMGIEINEQNRRNITQQISKYYDSHKE